MIQDFKDLSIYQRSYKAAMDMSLKNNQSIKSKMEMKSKNLISNN